MGSRGYKNIIVEFQLAFTEFQLVTDPHLYSDFKLS